MKGKRKRSEIGLPSRDERRRQRRWDAIVEKTNDRLWKINQPPLGGRRR